MTNTALNTGKLNTTDRDGIRAEVDRCLGIFSMRDTHSALVEIDYVDAKKGNLGRCRYRHGRCFLTFNLFYWDKLSDAERLDVVRHEAAHAVDYFRRGTSDHSPVWRHVARMVGAKDRARMAPMCDSTAQMFEAAYSTGGRRESAWTDCGCIKTVSKVVGNRIRNGHTYFCQRHKNVVKVNFPA